MTMWALICVPIEDRTNGRPQLRSSPSLGIRRGGSVQAGTLCRQQVFDRRGVPPRPAPWRAFTHGFKLGGDLLERTIGRSRLDPGDQPD